MVDIVPVILCVIRIRYFLPSKLAQTVMLMGGFGLESRSTHKLPRPKICRIFLGLRDRAFKFVVSRCSQIISSSWHAIILPYPTLKYLVHCL